MKNVAQMMAAATAQHRAGKFAAAERAYNAVLGIERDHAGALSLLGALYVQTNQPDRAIAALEKALAANPADFATLSNLGTALLRRGRLAEAETRYREALRAQPGFPDTHNSLGLVLLEGNKVPEAAEAFEAALRLRPDYPNARCNLGNALRKLGKADAAIAQYQEVLRARPDFLDALFQLGETLRAVDRLDDAIAEYEKAVKRAPDNFRLLNNLGNLLREQGRSDEAIARYKEAVRLKPGYAESSVNLGTALRDLGRAEEAIACYHEALRLSPNDPNTHINIGVALFWDFGRIDEALARFDHVLKLDPDSVDARWNKALVLLARGAYREGFALYEWGFRHKGKRIAPFPTAHWDGKPFPGQRLLIWCEQGLGDSLQFIRYARLCKARGQGGKVIIMCPPALAQILKTNPHIDDVVTAAARADFDHHISMMSLPHVFGTTLETIPADIPYLSVTPDAATKWAPRFAGAKGFKVGLVWAGSPREGNPLLAFIDQRRSIHLSRFTPLLTVADVSFYSLQLGKPAAQIEALGLKDKIIDFTGDIADFMDTAAIIRNLDLVISVDTSVVHLAGALGAPVWVLSRFDADWRWLRNREQNPWYPSARVFGQTTPGDWDSVIAKVGQALAAEVAKQAAL